MSQLLAQGRRAAFVKFDGIFGVPNSGVKGAQERSRGSDLVVKYAVHRRGRCWAVRWEMLCAARGRQVNNWIYEVVGISEKDESHGAN